MSTDEFVTPKQLSERWQISESTLRRWRRNGYGPTFTKIGDQVGSKVIYRIKDVIEFEEKCTREPNNKIGA